MTGITSTQVSLAANDNALAAEIINSILYDKKGNPKFRMWLIKMGISIEDSYEYESIARLTIMEFISGKHRGKFCYDKVPFEKHAWIKLTHVIFSELEAKSLYSSRNNSLEDMMVINDEDGIEEPQEWMGVSEIDLFSFDAENIFTELGQREAFICRCLYYSDWTKKEIINYLDITHKEYEDSVQVIKEKFSD